MKGEGKSLKQQNLLSPKQALPNSACLQLSTVTKWQVECN